MGTIDDGNRTHRFCDSEGRVTSGRTKGQRCTGTLALGGVPWTCSNPIHEGLLGEIRAKGTVPDGGATPKVY